MNNLNIHSSIHDDLPDLPMFVRTLETGGIFRANRSFLKLVGFSTEELASQPFKHWIEPESLDAVCATIAGTATHCQIQHRTQNGSPLTLDMRVVQHGGETFVLGRQEENFSMEEGPRDSDDEATVIGTLHTIAQIIEEQNPGYKCSILLVADGRFVRGAGPSLPEEYNAAVDGYSIGPTVGSCGTAIYWNVPVIVEDIQTDPLWADLAALAKKAGVEACWSHPFISKSGNVLGALALYSPEPNAPTHEQLSRLRAAARMTGLAVERGRAEESLIEQRKRERELEEQLRQAAKMEALGVLAGGIAHDFNNVLSTILANAEFGREILPADSVVQEMLADIVEASKRAGQFCQGMLAYSWRGSLSSNPIEIGALVPELKNLVQASVSKKTKLDYALLEQPIYVKGDENQLLQVFMNLVTNAADAIGDNDGQIVVKSELAFYSDSELSRLDPQAELAPGEYLRLSVSDTGEGMAPSTVERIFDPFYSTKVTGHGLGLSAVKGIIKRHRGVILIESEVGHGTTFTVLLPTMDPTPENKSLAESTAPGVGAKCILVVDDEPALRTIISRKLKHAGFSILEAADGQEAVDVFSEHHNSIDCVLLDLSMPQLSGEETLSVIQKIRTDIPTIMMSGYSEQEVVDRFQDAGIAGCLQKPISSDVLLEAIQKAILKSS